MVVIEKFSHEIKKLYKINPSTNFVSERKV